MAVRSVKRCINMWGIQRSPSFYNKIVLVKLLGVVAVRLRLFFYPGSIDELLCMQVNVC